MQDGNANGTADEEAEADILAQEAAARLQAAETAVPEEVLALLLTEARTHYGWQDRPVAPELLRRAYDLAKMGPTSMNQQPLRLIFVSTPEAKERLRPCLMDGNVEKTMTAPVTAIVAHDDAFHERLPELFPPNPEARDFFESAPKTRAANAMRNGTLQGAYLMIALRAVGLDVGAMSGFYNKRVDEAFFMGTDIRSNFLLNIGYADTSKVFRRLPRLPFEAACQIV